MDKKNRKPLIAGNWKMNKLASEALGFWSQLRQAIKLSPEVEGALCVPFPLIPAMQTARGDCPILVGAQDVSSHEAGAYTGEVSAAMLADLGVAYGIVGHSERRTYHGETDALVNQKLLALLRAGIAPILCVGESLEQRDAGQTLDFVEGQVRNGLKDVPEVERGRVIVAYEPIWAIGTGRTATAEQAQEVCGHIRAVLAELFGAETARHIRVLYGGSMNGKNAASLLAKPDIDGGLIGGASLKPLEFADIIGAANEG
ncbi:MAG: triose-phosphate isomerase [Oscillospiraceae bacterium]|nr:triose-phosphate isomerase [Oscillospiraceae bacterium]